MKTLTRALAALLSVTLASQNALAQFSRAVVRPLPAAPMAPVGAAAGLRVTAAPVSAPTLSLPAGLAAPLAGPLAAPLALPTPQALPLPLAGEGGVRVNAAVAAPAVVSPAISIARPHPTPLPQAGEGENRKQTVAERVTELGKSVVHSVEGVAALPQSGARDAAAAQFSLLTGERVARSVPASDAVPVVGAFGTLSGPRLSRPNPAAEEGQKDEVPAPPAKKGWLKVFNDPERNSAFWRYFVGSSIFSFGFQMYMVALPYLIKSFVQNTQKEAGKLDQLTKEQLTEMVRQNRSMSRIAHWVAQAVSYVAVPMFNDGQSGPRKWLVRGMLVRAAALAAVPALFFATGFLSAGAAMWTLFGLISVQSFFQGLSITMEAGGTARIFGDKSVTTEERLRANSIMSFTGAIIAIIAPVVAGRIAGIPDWMGKMGTGNAVLYGIYAGTIALAAFIYAGIKMLGVRKAEASAGGEAAEPAPKGFGGQLKTVLTSMKEGLKLILKNRFLLTLAGLNLLGSLFSDPLVFNVLPEFAEGVLKASPGAMNWAMGIPGLGWFLNGLISTPMGFFGLLVAFSSIGSAIVAVTVEPLRRLFKRLGFKTEESLTIPFYILAALEVPAFWAMVYMPSFWGVLLLYGAQTLATGYASLIISGIYQKQLGAYSSKQLTQVLAANSFVSILAAIASTYIYGFALTGITIQTSLLIAAVATTVVGVLHVLAPWLYFTKAQRKGEPDAPVAPKHAPLDPHRDASQGTDNMPGKHGPLSIGL